MAAVLCSSSAPGDVTFSGTTGGTYSSTSGLSINASSGQITPSSSTPGSYTVTYTVAASGGCALYTATTSVMITVQPVATISYGGSPFCSSSSPGDVTFSGTTGGTYSSTSGLSINASSGQVTPSSSTPGSYTVTYTVVASGGCALYTATTSVTITAQPAATISYGGSPFCSSSAPGDVTFSGTTGGAYSSTSGLSINASSGQITPSTSTPGTYTVTYTVAASAGCAQYTTTTSVIISATPAQPSIGAITQPTCTTTTGSFTITNFNASYNYTFSPTGPAVNGSGVVTAAAGTYSITATLALCTSAALTNITVNPQPATPVITSVAVTTPINGQVNNNGYYGQEITISGNSFAANTTVSINGITAFNNVIQSAGEIKAVVPIGAVASGDVVVTNPSGSCVAQTSFTVLGYVTRATGDWNTITQNSTWLGSEYASFPDPRPVANATVTINDATTVNSNVAAVPAIITITGTGSVTQAITTTLSTLSLVNNGSVTTAGTITINGPSNNASGKNITVNSGGVLAVGGTMTNSGSLSIDGTGIFRIDANGAIVTNAPTYAATSTLVYNPGTSYNRGSEWTSALGVGFPGNVTVQGGTTLNIGTHAIGLAKDLSLGVTGSAGSLTFVAGPTALKVGGNVSIGSSGETQTSTLTIFATGLNNGVWLDGNWTRYPNGVFIPNQGRVSFTGIVDKFITVAGGGTESFYELQINKADISTKANVILADGTSVVVNDILRLREGYIVSTQINKLTVNNPLFSSVSGSTSSYVKGPLTRKMPDVISYNEYKFFVGVGSDFLPFSVYNPGGSSAYLTVEAFKNDVGPSATFDATAIADISHAEYWKATLLSGSLSAGYVSLAKSPLGTNNVVARSAAQIGSYVSLAGTVAGSTYPGNTITSTIETGSNFGYFVLAAALPNPVITSVAATTQINTQGNDNGYFGQEITITGSNFASNATISFNGVAAFSTSYVNATSIKAVVALGTPINGNVVVTNPTTGGSGSRIFTVLGYVSRAAGDWNITSTWMGGNLSGFPNAVPVANSIVTINNDVTANGVVANAPNAVKVLAGQSLTFTTMGSTLNVNNTLTNAGTITMTAGGTINLGGSSTLANTGTFTGGSGLVNFTGTSGSSTVSGTPSLNNVTIAATINFINNAPISGTFLLTGNALVQNAPTYQTGSLLKYSTNNTYNRTSEWNNPYNVQISNNTTLSAGGSSLVISTGIRLNVAGNLTIDAGSSFYMDFGGFNMTVPLKVEGDININGNLSASGVAPGDIEVSGNWNHTTGTFNPGGRAVFFKGTSNALLFSNSTEIFDYLYIEKTGSGDVTLQKDIAVNQQLGLTSGKINSTATNIISINPTANTAISGGSATSFINGPVKWKLPANNSSLLYYKFPVGKGGYFLPFTLFKPITGNNAPYITAEAFAGQANLPGNVDNTTVTGLSTTEHWKAAVLPGGNLTSAIVSVKAISALPVGAVIAQSTDDGNSDFYSSIGGTVGSDSIYNSSPADPGLGTFAIGIACPKLDFDYNTITSFCTSGGTVSARYLNGGSAGVFSSTPSLSGLNASTGAIDLALAAAGTYTIKNSPASGSCTNFSSVVITITAQPSSTISYPGSPFCSASTGLPTITGTGGGTFSASPTGLSIATDGTITASTSTPGTYTVTYTIAPSGGCAQYTTLTNITIDPATFYVWTGASSTNWNTATNWKCGNVPGAGSDVTIPSTVNKPMLSAGAIGMINNLVLESGATLTVSANELQIGGTITNNGGIVNAVAGAITYNGTSNQIIPAALYNTNTIGSLNIQNLTGVTLANSITILNSFSIASGQIDIDAAVSLSINGTYTGGGALNNNGTIIFNGTTLQDFPGASTVLGTFNNLTVNNTGDIRLDNDLIVNGTLALSGGNLNLNGKTLSLDGSFSKAASYALIGSRTSDLVIGSEYSGGVLYFHQVANSENNFLNSLTLNANATLGSTLKIAPSLFNNGLLTGFVKVAAGSLFTNDYLVLTSEETGTARIARGERCRKLYYWQSGSTAVYT